MTTFTTRPPGSGAARAAPDPAALETTAPTLEEQITEVIRELRVRDQVFPKLVFAGKLSKELADRRQRALRAALASLRDLQAATNGRA